MFERLMQAARAAANTAPVETEMFFDDEKVGYRMLLAAKGKQTIGTRREFTWMEVGEAKDNPIPFYIAADREALIAKMEGPRSTNPNREHDVR